MHLQLFVSTLRWLRIPLVCAFALLGPGWLLAQTCAVPGLTGPVTLSTVPNSYYPGTANAAAGATSITLGTRNAAGAAVDIAPGDLLLVIQMQGAEINSSDTNQYGDGVGSGANQDNTGDPARGSLAGHIAGQYEFAVATNAVAGAGGAVNLSAPLTYSYVNADASVTQGQRRFQVLRVPQYSSLTLSGTINLTPWNGTSGGVFVVDVAGSLALGGATLNASGRGFRGGGGFQQDPLCTAGGGTAACQDYRAANANPARGAFKGEGIAGTPAFLYSTANSTLTGSATGANGYPNGDRARGAPANAGGGGNQHNAGGGGNGGQGGTGGNTWNGSTTTFEGQRYGGFGGAAGYNLSTRIVMGGGGGAGDIGGNTRTPVEAGSGGSGGGIVMIRAGAITGIGTINANGGNGISPTTGTDAAGGGGAGGTIWITTGNGTLPGTLAMTANGGSGANSGPMGSDETDGPGGGGGGGVLITNSSGANFTANGGAFGVMNNSNSDVCGNFAPSTNPQCFATAGGIGNTVTMAVPVPNTGVRLGHECLPDLRVTKATTTPQISASGATTAQYTINIQNFGGGARNVVVQDPTLPVAPNWTRNATAPTYAYLPALPIAANNLPAGAEASTTDNGATFPLAATPGTVPASGANALTWRQFFLPPIKAGVPSQVTITFVANIPATASVGCYHNAAGVSFLDSTRLNTTRTVTPPANNSANRTGVAYAPNSTYGSGTATVAGNNYSGLPAGPAGEDVCLQGNLSVTKTGPASVTAGQTLTYTLVATNAGRQIRNVDFTTHQATTATNSVTSTAILPSGNLRITDTLPASLTVTSAFTGAGWTCTQVGQNLSCDRTTAVPLTATTVIGTVTGTVRVSNTACSGPLVNTVTIGALQSPYSETSLADNSATASTTLNCNAALSITKTNTVTSMVAGSTTSYLISATNTGPSSADGAIMRDTPSAGLSSCTVTACTASGGTPTASCPIAAQWPNLLLPAGVAIPGFPSGGNVQFTVQCNVTATGLP